ncbi:MAG: 50S ribosomal protein L18 [Christensenellales bacterium]
MINKPDKNKIRVARHRRTRKNIMGTAECPRMDVFRSNSHIYVQLIDDAAGRTLVASSTLDPAIRDQVKEMSKVEAAKLVGNQAGKKALEAGIKQVVFDRGGYLYTGRVANVAEGGSRSRTGLLKRRDTTVRIDTTGLELKENLLP